MQDTVINYTEHIKFLGLWLDKNIKWSIHTQQLATKLSKIGFAIRVIDRLCGLAVRVLGYRSGGPGSIPGTTKKKIVGMERGPLSLVSTTEELLDRKVAASV
jgi:hypothetical protein